LTLLVNLVHDYFKPMDERFSNECCREATDFSGD
jgi:hypothetical protein